MLTTRKNWPLAILILISLLSCSKETNTPDGASTTGEPTIKRIETLADAPMETEAKEVPPPAITEVEPIPVVESQPEEPVNANTQYVVKPGDTLWSIAAKQSIYGNAHDWPLIYRSNVAKIRDPDLIKPGMVLIIDHSYSDVEMQSAQKHARERGEWHLGKLEASDLAYLKQGL